MLKQNEYTDRIPELDGVRGLAILLVIAFHTFKRADVFTNSEFLHQISDLTKIGWAGVDVFFVLSGFLITGILLKTKENPNYFKNFYVRRILRIFPLYYLLIGFLLIFLPQLDRGAGEQTQSLWPFFLLYQQNWLYISKSELSLFLGFTWSLAIEEQFYFLWPALVFFLKKRILIWAGIGIILNSILMRLILTLPFFKIADLEEFFYYGTITRFEGLILGGLIAVAFYDNGKWKARLIRWAWPALIISLGLFTLISITGTPSPTSDNELLTIWGYTLLALISGALIILITNEPNKSIIRLIFGNKVMRFFGKYSYAMYMFHMPILIILMDIIWKTGRQNGWMWFLYIIISFSLTIMFSLLSWNLLEKHMLKLKKYFE